MRSSRLIKAAFCVAVAALTSPASAQIVAPEEALTVANNWITRVIAVKGAWGDQQSATAVEAKDLTWRDRTVGYFCPVQPRGYILVSPHKVLQPIKAYSATGAFDPEGREGAAAFLRGAMFQALEALESQAGPIESADVGKLRPVLQIDYQPAWEQMTQPAGQFIAAIHAEPIESGYVQGRILLTSAWAQGPPFNNWCPNHDCDQYEYNTNTPTGCTATATAQVMRYWAWPPYGDGGPGDHVFDWVNMFDGYMYDGSGGFWGRMGATWQVCSQAQVDAVAKLCYEIGDTAGMLYACSGSFLMPGPPPWWLYPCGVPLFPPCPPNMQDALEDHFRFASAEYQARFTYTGSWWELIKDNINRNWPTVYAAFVSSNPFEGAHSFVCDGWEDWHDGSLGHFAHMNYGYAVDGYPGGDDGFYDIEQPFPYAGGTETMLHNIRPVNAVGATISAGTYGRDASFAYRYFDQDASGQNASFSAGQRLQCLPGVVVACNGTAIRFEGSTGAGETRLFSRGDPSKGIKIVNGSLLLNAGGRLRLP